MRLKGLDLSWVESEYYYEYCVDIFSQLLGKIMNEEFKEIIGAVR